MALGYSFQPGADQQNGTGVGNGSRPNGARTSPSSSIKVLNLRVPKREAPRSVAPQALLESRGMAGAPAGFDPQLINLMTRAFQSPAQGGAPVIPNRGGGNYEDTTSSDPAGISGARFPQYPPMQAPSAGPSQMGPVFTGHIDTPPMQNAPSLFSGEDNLLLRGKNTGYGYGGSPAVMASQGGAASGGASGGRSYTPHFTVENENDLLRGFENEWFA